MEGELQKSNMNTSLGYEVRVLKHFAEKEMEKEVLELQKEVKNLTISINRDTLGFLEECYNFVNKGGWKNSEEVVLSL